MTQRDKSMIGVMMSNDVQIPVQPVHVAGPAPISLGRVIPTPVLAFCALLILIGAILLLTRAARLESSAARRD